MNWKGAFRTPFLFLAACAASFGDTLVVPNNQATAPGNLAVSVGANASRFQQIVGGGQFPGPILITGIRLRAAPGSGPVGFNYSSIKITLSTTQAYPNTINGHKPPSTSFAANVGPDASTVFNAQSSASSPGCAAPGPCPFDMVISLATPFSFDPSKGRLLVDIVTSATNGTPTGSLDGVQFPDSSSSSVASVSGDPTQATGSLSLAGLVLGLEVSTSLSGPFGFLIHSSFSNPSTDASAVLGVMNFDGAGNVTGAYDLEIGSGGTQAGQSITGTLTGTYSTSLGAGSATIALDVGITVTFAIVITDGGQSLRLLATSCGGDCDISGDVISGFARAAYRGPLKGSYGFQLHNYPNPLGAVGVATFDGAGNIAAAATTVSAGNDPKQPPMQRWTSTGTYSVNPDGTGTVNFADDSTYSFVITEGGSEVLLLQTNRSGNGVQFGTARQQ